MAALTGEEKAALLLLSLAPQVSDAILGQLGPAVKTRLGGHMERLGKAPQRQELLNQVLQEAERMLQQPPEQPAVRLMPTPASGTPDKAPGPRLAATERSSDPAPAILSMVPRQAPPKEPGPANAMGRTPAADEDIATGPLAVLNRLDPARIGLALAGESARTVALVLNCIDTEKAGTVFKQLPPTVRREVSAQMATSATPSTEILQRTVTAIVTKVQSLPANVSESSGDARFKKIAELLRQLERTDRNEALAALQERDLGAAARVREMLYVFEDIVNLDGKSVQKVLGEIDSKTLAIAVKGATEDITQKIMDNMSKRAREGLTEEVGYLGTVPKSQIHKAQRAVADVIQKLEQSGELVMR